MKTLSFPSIGTLALALTMCLSSCSDADITLLEGTAIGGIAGGGAAFGLAKAFGASNENAAYIGAGGAVLGGLIGNRWGASIVKEKGAYATQEAYLKANIKQVNNRISEATSTNQKLASTLSDLKTKKAVLTQDAYNQTKKAMAQQTGLIDQDLNTAREALKDSSGAEATELRNRIAELKNQRNALTRNVANMKSYVRKV